MAKFIKLPDELKSWKIISALSEGKGGGVYKITKKDYDGTTINARLLNISVKGDDYNSEHIDFIEDEASFLQTVSRCGNKFNYIDIFVSNQPAKEKIDLYIITEELTSLTEVLKTKQFSEEEIVDFGIQLSSVLESLEAKNIFHGNLMPDNIYVTNDGTYKVGGFSDFESSIKDFSFVAPEIYKKESADFTTDIYSLGLIMYYMSNGNKLPFENDSNDKNTAVEKRISGADVSSPANGSDKLKSVIMIACKADNKYRWKNAGNIKNALLSMKTDTAPAQTAAGAVSANTDFDGNVFEEFEYTEPELPNQEEKTDEQVLDSAENETTESSNTESTDTEFPNQDNVSENITNIDADLPSDNDKFNVIEPDNDVSEQNNSTDYSLEANETADKAEISDDKAEINTMNPVIAKEAIADEQIFDKIEATDKKQLKYGFENKDYGSYFDDDDEIKPETKKPIAETDNFDVDSKDDEKGFDDDYNNFTSNSDDSESSKKSKKKAVIIVSIIAVLVILGCAGFIAFSGIIDFGNTDNTQPSTQATTEITAPATTAVPTTQPTTAEQTTVSPDADVTPVVGYGYSYAKKLLEEAGFTVEIGEYRYSDDYPEGYVIAQSPEGSVTAKKGTVVTLDISSGLIEPATEEITEAPTQAPTEAPAESSVEKTNNSFIFPNSSTSYISKADVEKLSADELNIAINEIYARYGRIFKNASLAEYFNSQSWYTPKYTPEEFDANVQFNEYEQTNLRLLISYR